MTDLMPGAIEIPENLGKFLDVAMKHLEFCTTMSTLLLGAVAYVVAKHFLERPKSDRPSIFWIFPPVIFAIVSLALTLVAYREIEDAYLQGIPILFANSWQTIRLWITLSLVAGTLSLCLELSIGGEAV